VCFSLLLLVFLTFIAVVYKNKFLSNKVHMCNIETNLLIMFKEVIIYCENLMQHISSLCGKMQSFLTSQDMVCVNTFGS
jgi:hypothetical protein